jgi:hypothetical protein
MSTKSYIVGFLRQHPRHKISEQEVWLKEAGALKLYSDLELCIRQRRPGDVVAVTHAHLLSEPKDRRKKGGPRQSLYSALDGFKAKKTVVWEVSTNRRTDDADQRELMVREAIEKLARTRVHSDRKGRPPRKWTQEELETIEWHWRSLGHETNEEAIAAMRAEGIKRISVSIVSKRFGPSGRDKIKRK